MPPWPALCEAVAKLRVRLLEGELVALHGGAAPAAASSLSGPSESRGTALGTFGNYNGNKATPAGFEPASPT